MKHLKIDFISDVTCPWCMIGLHELQEAFSRVSELVQPELTFQPFEINPNIPAEGRVALDYVTEKHGSSATQVAAIGKQVRARAAQAGLAFNMTSQNLIYNTFDAHRLLHWAKTKDRQVVLKKSLFNANFADCANISDKEVLVAISSSAGLDGGEAKEVLASGRYAEDVRGAQRVWMTRGINSVPTIVIDDRSVVSGAQSAQVFEQVLRRFVS